MKVGSKVQKNHVYDGSKLGGEPIGKILTITEIEDHNPVDGPTRKNEITWLSDGTWSFPWNLTKKEE